MASPIVPDSADPRDESAFTPFTLYSAQDLAEASGTEAEATALPILLPLLTLVAIFVFPSALSGVGFMAVRALGSNIDVSTAAGTAFTCVALQGGRAGSGWRPLAAHPLTTPHPSSRAPRPPCSMSMMSMVASSAGGPTQATALSGMLAQARSAFAGLLGQAKQ